MNITLADSFDNYYDLIQALEDILSRPEVRACPYVSIHTSLVTNRGPDSALRKFITRRGTLRHYTDHIGKQKRRALVWNNPSPLAASDRWMKNKRRKEN
jgi:hypothetical protein